MSTESMQNEGGSRVDAMHWLINNITEWPAYMDRFATGRIISNWRFVDTLPDREIVFANGLHEAITKDDWFGIMMTYHGPDEGDKIH